MDSVELIGLSESSNLTYDDTLKILFNRSLPKEIQDKIKKNISVKITNSSEGDNIRIFNDSLTEITSNPEVGELIGEINQNSLDLVKKDVILPATVSWDENGDILSISIGDGTPNEPDYRLANPSIPNSKSFQFNLGEALNEKVNASSKDILLKESETFMIDRAAIKRIDDNFSPRDTITIDFNKPVPSGLKSSLGDDLSILIFNQYGDNFSDFDGIYLVRSSAVNELLEATSYDMVDEKFILSILGHYGYTTDIVNDNLIFKVDGDWDNDKLVITFNSDPSNPYDHLLIDPIINQLTAYPAGILITNGVDPNVSQYVDYTEAAASTYSYFSPLSDIQGEAKINTVYDDLRVGINFGTEVTNAIISFDFSQLGITPKAPVQDNDAYLLPGGYWTDLTDEFVNDSTITFTNVNSTAEGKLEVNLGEKILMGTTGKKKILITVDSDGTGPLSAESHPITVNVSEECS
ncbi:hypothetical protein [Metabacillus fastidiosus]|uniref:hypothetical protein n=1 Tax=Metabacillus fastidiosus TaxID=1458 RepID=UPI003D2E2F40